jgi:hypothetical protein
MGTTRALETPEGMTIPQSSLIWLRYYYEIVKVDPEAPLTKVVLPTVENIIKLVPRRELCRDELIQSLCSKAFYSSEFHKFFLSSGREQFLQNRKWCTLDENTLAAAVHMEDFDLTKRLLSESGFSDAFTFFGHPIDIAFTTDNRDILQLLLDYMDDVKIAETALTRVLRKAPMQQRYDLISVVLQSTVGQKVITTKILESAIHNAIRAGCSVECINHVIQQSEDAFQRPSHSAGIHDRFVADAGFYSKILAVAATAGREDVVKEALDRGADPNFQSSLCFPDSCVAEAAASRSHHGIVQLLVSRGAAMPQTYA